MKLKLSLFTFIAILTLFVGANSALAQGARPCDNLDRICNAIKQNNQKFESAIANKNATAVAQLYSTDGQVLPPNAQVFSGRAAIAQYWQGALNAGVTAVDLQTLEVYGDGQTVTEVGRAIVYGPGGVVIDRGKYVVVWVLRNNVWQLHRDILNSDLPCPPQQ